MVNLLACKVCINIVEYLIIVKLYKGQPGIKGEKGAMGETGLTGEEVHVMQDFIQYCQKLYTYLMSSCL